MIEVKVLFENAYWDVANLAPQIYFFSKFYWEIRLYYGLCKALESGTYVTPL